MWSAQPLVANERGRSRSAAQRSAARSDARVRRRRRECAEAKRGGGRARSRAPSRRVAYLARSVRRRAGRSAPRDRRRGEENGSFLERPETPVRLLSRFDRVPTAARRRLVRFPRGLWHGAGARASPLSSDRPAARHFSRRMRGGPGAGEGSDALRMRANASRDVEAGLPLVDLADGTGGTTAFPLRPRSRRRSGSPPGRGSLDPASAGNLAVSRVCGASRCARRARSSRCSWRAARW